MKEGLTDVIVSLGVYRVQRLGWAFSSAIGVLGLSETGTGDRNHVDRNDSLKADNLYSFMLHGDAYVPVSMHSRCWNHWFV